VRAPSVSATRRFCSTRSRVRRSEPPPPGGAHVDGEQLAAHHGCHAVRSAHEPRRERARPDADEQPFARGAQPPLTARMPILAAAAVDQLRDLAQRELAQRGEVVPAGRTTSRPRAPPRADRPCRRADARAGHRASGRRARPRRLRRAPHPARSRAPGRRSMRATTSLRLSTCCTLKVVWTSMPASSSARTSCQRFSNRDPGRWCAPARRRAPGWLRASAASRSSSVSVAPRYSTRRRGNHSSPSQQCSRLDAAVRLDEADHDVDALAAQPLRTREHRERLPDPRCGAEVDLQPAAARLRRFALHRGEQLRRGRAFGIARTMGIRVLRSACSAPAVEREVEFEHVDEAAPPVAHRGRTRALERARRPLGLRHPARHGDARDLVAAAASVMCGSSPPPEAAARSAGSGRVGVAPNAATIPLARSVRSGLVGDLLLPPAPAALYPTADGRGQK
jgi:hypothetical protein